MPEIHVHAFSPLEIWQGAKTLGRAVPDFLRELKAAGLGSFLIFASRNCYDAVSLEKEPHHAREREADPSG